MTSIQLKSSEFEVADGVHRITVDGGVSRLSSISAVFRSAFPSHGIGAVVGQPAALTVTTDYAFALNSGQRAWTGVCSYMAEVEVQEQGISTYELRIAPQLWLLTQRRNFKIFQHQSIVEIVTALLEEWKILHRWQVDAARYPKLEHRVQYGESDYAFMSRLLEEAGIAFTFVFDGEHSIVVLGDDLPAADVRPGTLAFVDHPNEASEQEYVTHVRLGTEVRPGALSVRDYEFRKPGLGLFGAAPEADGLEAKYEQYLYGPGSMLAETGTARQTPVADSRGVAQHDAAHGETLATGWLEAQRTGRKLVRLHTNAIDLAPGRVFTMAHPNPALGGRRLLVTEQIIHGALNGEWTMAVEAVFADKAYRPPRKTPKPQVKGVQSATVVGPPGQEIHVDEHGRVRVKFPWDRAPNVDDDSSCWLRVNHQWAGTGYGWLNLPRIGQEVLVSFLNGDPDRPVLMGRTFNRTNPVIYHLPANKTISSWKSMSSPRSGGYNEIQFEDKAGDELYFLQAEKNLRKLVKNDEIITVAHNRHKLVKANEFDTTLVNRVEVTAINRAQLVGAVRTTLIGGNRSKQIGGVELVRTEGNHQMLGGGDRDVVVKGNKREHIGVDQHLLVNGNRCEKIDGKQSLVVIENQFEKVKGSHALEAGKKVFLHTNDVMMGEAPDITIKGPGGFIRIDASGVTIKGTLVNINVGGSPGKGKEPTPEAPDPAEVPLLPPPPGYIEEVLSPAIPYGVELPSAPGFPEIRGVEKTAALKPPPPKPEAPIECELQQITYTCSHGARGYTITLPLPDGAKPEPLEVIAGPLGAGGDTIKPELTMALPHCGRHEGQQLRIVASGHVNEVKSGDLSFEVNTFRPHGIPRLKLLANLWPWNAAPVVYRATPAVCQGGRNTALVVHAYPDITVTVNVALMLNMDEFEKRLESKADLADSRGGYHERRGRPAHTDWKFVVGGKIQYGSETLALDAAFKDKIRKIASVNLMVKRAIDTFCGVFQKWFGIKIYPELPNLTIEAEGKFVEVKGTRKVDTEWKVMLLAKPLIGLTVKLDVLDVMIKALSKTAVAPLAIGLDKFRKWADGHGTALEVWLKFTGLILGEAGAQKIAGADKITPAGAVKGELKVEVGAKATFKGSMVISVEAGAEIKAHTGIGAELSLAGDGKGVYVQGKFYLEACKLEWAVYISTTVIWEVKEEDGGVYTFWDRKDLLESKKYYVLSEEAGS